MNKGNMYANYTREYYARKSKQRKLRRIYIFILLALIASVFGLSVRS